MSLSRAVNERFLVINASSPEVDHLAGELSRTGVLSSCVRRYANIGRAWERAASGIPGIGGLYRATVGRRTLPPRLDSNRVIQAGVFCDFMMAVAMRSPWRRGRMQAADALLDRRERLIAAKGAELAADASVVVSATRVAKRAFQAVHRRGGRAVLSYQIAHHRYTQRLLAEEAEREPEFAATINPHVYPPALAALLEEECELADHILVGSSFVRDSFIAEGIDPNKLTAIPYGTDTSLFVPGAEARKDGKFRVLFVGQIGQRKGIAYLLRAYDRFKGPGTELKLVGRFVGPPQVFTPYRHLFEHCDNVPRPALAEIYREADVLVLPTLVEGMPLVVLEAMASGLPVIATANGPGDIVRDGIDGFIVPIRSVDAIVEKLEFLRAHPDARAEMGRAARARALQFTWDAYASKAAAVVLSQGRTAALA